MLKAKIAFRLFLFSVLLSTSFHTRAQETCATTSRNPFEWPGHRHWYVAPNLFSGATINMQTMAVTSRGNAFGPVRSYEGVTAASDDAGNLLFYSNGRSVWTGGAGGPATETYSGLLEGNEGGINNGSASQGVITVRHPLDPDRYWIITTDDALSGTNGMNAFSFDATGGNLSGPTRLGAFRTSEGISATLHDNGVDVWVTCLASGTGQFHSFLLECDGFNDPAVVSSVGPVVNGGRERGGIAYSWNGEYLAQAHPNWSPHGDKIVSIYRFNKATGAIYDAKNVSGVWGSPYDVSWSPDNSKVYVSMQNGQLHYLDITSWDAATINGTWTSTGVGTAFAGMEVGPDGNMYLAHGVAGGGFLKRVNGDLNAGGAFSTTNIAGTAGMSHLGLPTMYIPPAEEPDIEEVGPYCTTDAPVDLNTTWICSGVDAEDPVKNPTAYTGPGITDQANGIFSPAVAGEGTHQIIFTYCQVNDTIEIVVNNCVTCESELDDQTPEICVGETFTLDPLVTNASADGVWSIDSMPVGTSPVITLAADTVFDASNLSVTVGTYKLIYTVNDSGEECYDSVYIVVNPLPEPDLGPDQEICIGDAAVTFDAGVFASYLWQPGGEITQTIDTDVAGEYVVTVTDANTCEGNDTVNLIVNPLPTPDLGVDQAICIGDAAVTLDPGAYAAYAWQPGGEVSQTIDTDVAGEYIVTVTDANGCEGNDTVNLVVNPLPTPDLGADQEICAGDAVVTFDAGAFDAYTWQPGGEITQTIDTDVDGEYIVTVTDANGCEANDTVVLTVNPLPTPDLGADQAICIGDAAVTFDAGAFDAYAWQPGAEITQTIDTDVDGEYIVTVTDANGCEGNDTVNLVVNPLPTPDLGVDQTICIGDAAVTFDAGVFASYLWQQGGEVAQTIDTDVAGEYIVTVTDANGCMANDTVNLIVNPLPTPDLGADQEICAGDAAVTFDAGAFDAYAWQPGGEITQTIDTDVDGEYIVTVTDANGCEANDTVVLTVNPLPTPDLGADQAICIGDAAVTFDAGAFDAYAWQPGGEITQTIDTDVDGEYIITVTDANGCEGNDTVVLTVNPLPTPDLGVDQVICAGDAAVTFDAGAYDSYAWQPGGEVSQTIDTDVAGEFIVTVTDANGCMANDTVNLIVNPIPTPDLGADQIICAGDPAVTFDAGAYDTYAWQPGGDITQTIDTDVDGEYIVTVTDANGCEANDTVLLTVNALPTPDLGPDTEICEGGLGIIFDADVYDSYAWFPRLEITQTINTDSAGVYAVEVTDANGCIGTDTVELIVNPNPIVDLGPNRTICPGSSVELDAGAGFTSYVWNDASMTQTKDVDDTNAGEYSVLVIDANSCSGRDTVEVIVAAELSVNIGNDTAFCDGGLITVDAGAIGGATYAWQPGGEATQTLDISTTGEYSVLVTDPMGCSGRDTIVVTVNPNPTVDLGPDVTVCPDVDSMFTVGPGWTTITWNDASSGEDLIINTAGRYFVDVVDANGCTATDTAEFAFFAGATVDLGSDITICPGTNANFDAGAFASYTWHDGSGLQTFTGTIAEKIWVDVVDANGCEAVDTAEIFMATSLPVALGNDTAVCEGESVTLQSGYPVLGYTFTWAPTGETTNEITVSTAGTYDVLVEDAAGCTGRDTIVVTINPLPVVDLGPDKTICEGDDDLFSAGAGWSSVVWNTSELTNDITVDSAGIYAVTVTDANGCEDIDSVELVVNLNPTPDLGTDQTVCPGSQALFDAGLYSSYVWQDLSVLATYESTTEEKIWVTVTDVNGCIGSDTADIFVRDALLVDIGPDLDTCDGNTIDIIAGYASAAGYSFAWNTGEATEQITVSTTGRYYVDVVDVNGCEGTDTVDITVHPNPAVDLGPDQSVCEGESFTFDAGAGWSAIAWNDASIAQTLEIDVDGNYSVVVTDANGCEATDDVNLILNVNPTVDLGADVEVCPGIEVTFTPDPTGFTSYTWHDGSIGNDFSTINPERVWVDVIDANGCTATDTAELTNLPALNVVLPDDQTLCEGETFEITVPGFDPALHTFAWSDGSAASTLTVGTTDTYSVFVSNGGGCAGFDTIRVEVNANPTPVVDDLTVCEGEAGVLGLTESFAGYVWDSGDITREINVTTAGDYAVTVMDLNGCTGSTSATFAIVSQPVIETPTDRSACEGEVISLTPVLPAGTYEWKPTGESTSTIDVTTAGAYEVVVTNAGGCKDSVTINVSYNLNPILDLGPDVVVCEGYSVTIGANGNGNPILWESGVVADSIAVNIQADYAAVITDDKGCIGRDTINV